MNEQVTKQNKFLQTRVNQAKLGAYYTDPQHCRWMAELLEFPKGEEVCCLEPAIGDANAVCLVTKKKENMNIHIFGVDLNEDTVDTVNQNPDVEECLWGDFLTDVIVSPKAFSFCYSNPPYGEENGKRIEVKFLRKIIPCLTQEAVLVYVIPQYVAESRAFQEVWNSFLSLECGYRFREKEFEKWKQVVLIGRKKAKEGDVPKENMLQWSGKEEIPLLPSAFSGEKIRVPNSNSRELSVFTTKDFNYNRALSFVQNSSLAGVIEDRIQQEKYITDRLKRPPIMPNAGQMYLMAISGAGQGLVGSENTKDLHLQRGIVKNTEESEIQESEDGYLVEVVRKYSKISFNIIENSGKIHSM